MPRIPHYARLLRYFAPRSASCTSRGRGGRGGGGRGPRPRRASGLRARYCSPAVDLSVFLFLNTTASQRAAHWDDFFVAYYDGLTTALRRLLSGSSTDPTLSPTMEMPSLAAIRADFARHALYGFVICSYFLPVMQAGPQEGSEGSTEEMYAVVRSIPDKFEAGQTMASFLEYLGEDGENTVADLLLEFVDRGLVGL